MDSLVQSDYSDSDLERPPRTASASVRGHGVDLKSTFDTFKLATANKMHIGGLCIDSPVPSRTPGLGSSYDSGHADLVVPYLPDSEINSYTISRFEHYIAH